MATVMGGCRFGNLSVGTTKYRREKAYRDSTVETCNRTYPGSYPKGHGDGNRNDRCRDTAENVASERAEIVIANKWQFHCSTCTVLSRGTPQDKNPVTE